MKSNLLKDEFGPVIQEIQHREIKVTKLKVVKAPAQSGLSGTMVVVLARAGSDVLPELRAALKEGGARLTKFHNRLLEQYRSAQRTSREDAVKAMVQAPVLADVRYGGNTLNSGIHVPQNIDCAVAIFPYNGGKLAAEGFELVQYPKAGAKDRLEGIVVETAPELSAVELAALRLVPASQLGRNVGVSVDCETTYWALAFLGAGLLGIGLLGTPGSVVLGQETHLTETQIKRLGPAASARELLALRREALLGAKVG